MFPGRLGWRRAALLALLLAALICGIVYRSWLGAQARAVGVLSLTSKVPVLAWATREATDTPHVQDELLAGRDAVQENTSVGQGVPVPGRTTVVGTPATRLSVLRGVSVTARVAQPSTGTFSVTDSAPAARACAPTKER